MSVRVRGSKARFPHRKGPREERPTAQTPGPGGRAQGGRHRGLRVRTSNSHENRLPKMAAEAANVSVF